MYWYCTLDVVSAPRVRHEMMLILYRYVVLYRYQLLEFVRMVLVRTVRSTLTYGTYRTFRLQSVSKREDPVQFKILVLIT